VSDPRFARDIGERTGYVPNAIQCIAVMDGDGDVGAVLSILDRGSAASTDETVGASGVIGHVVELVAALIAVVREGSDLEARLAALRPDDRARATAVVAATLDAFES
jgi:hypothetical protein